MSAGLYIVSLNNNEEISVNSNDPRMANRCIKVTRAHCKFGKARNLPARRRNYEKVFGAQNVNFRAIVEMDDISIAERLVLGELRAWRVRGRTGRLNEWLLGITPAEVESIVFATLNAARLSFVSLVHWRE